MFTARAGGVWGKAREGQWKGGLSDTRLWLDLFL